LKFTLTAEFMVVLAVVIVVWTALERAGAAIGGQPVAIPGAT
jgi:hypothetical protein